VEASERLQLTAAQYGIWAGQQLDPTGALYNAAECVEIIGPVQVDKLAHALRSAIDEAEVLHMQVLSGADGPVQVLRRKLDWPLPELDLGASCDPLRAAFDWMRADLSKPLAASEVGGLFRTALLVASPERVFVYLAVHHIALDGFGFSLIIRRVAQLYTALVRGVPGSPPTFGSLAAVVEEDLRYRSSRQCVDDRAFWQQRLLGAAAPVSLSGRSAFPSPPIRHAGGLPAPLKLGLDNLARPVRGSWADGLVAAFAGFMSEQTAQPAVSLGLPMMGRMGSASLRVPSMVMNIVPFTLVLGEGASFSDLLALTVTELRAIRPHVRYRYEQLRRDLKLVGGARRLFGPILNVMPFDFGLSFAELRACMHNVSAGPVEDLALNVHLRGDGGEPSLVFDANPLAYDAREVAHVASRFLTFLQRVLAAPTATLRPASATGRSVREGAPKGELRGEQLAAPAEDVVAMFLRRAALTPDKVAIEHLGRRLSYAELALCARRVAGALLRAGVTPDSVVAMLLPRGIEAVTVQLGVLMAGAAYLPIDPDAPRARTLGILADAEPVLIVTSELDSERARDLPGTILHVESLRDGEPCAAPVAGSQLAYVIYTSGSTGKPNGVLIDRAALAHFVAAATQRYGWSEHERVLQFAPLQFDASVEEIFVTLCTGGTLIVRDDAMLESIPRFLEACREHALTVLDLPTAFFHELAFAVSSSNLSLPASLGILIIGGEAALSERVARFVRVAGARLRLFNTYGPTETTVVVTTAVLSELPLKADTALPIGTPLAGVGAAIVDVSLREVPEGEVGELCICGPTLARGYLGRPELQASRFVTLELPDGRRRAYRTGDLVRSGEDGQLVFLGRVDDELKISGQRVDPSEVETVLLRHPQVREVAVVAQARSDGGKRLLAHVVGAASAAELRAHAQASLLAAAVPSAFLFSDALPKTSSGKVDRAQLRAPPAGVIEQPLPEPESPLEREILRVWREVLGSDDVSTHDDFFARGGHSLQSIQVATRLTVALGREVPVALVFRHPTVAELAAALADPSGPSEPTPDLSAREDALLAADIWPSTTVGEPPPRQVLLTGANGFVGAQLLHTLLRDSDARVVCLVRAENADRAHARLCDALSAQGLDSALTDRVQALAADLALPRFGLALAQFEQLARHCDTIFHSAATVSLVRGYRSMRAANVAGTEALIRFACSERTKPLHYVSTLAVAADAHGGELKEAFLPEPPALRDGYTLSKWAAERLVEQAAARGVPAAVYRLGRVVGAPDSGFVNPQDIVFRLLLAGIPRGVLPDLDIVEPWTPVDFIARTLVALSRQRATGKVFHLAPAPQVRLREVFAWVAQYGYDFELTPLAEFRARLQQAADVEGDATLAFFDVRGQHGGAAMHMGAVRCDNLMHALGEQARRCPVIDLTLVHAYLDYAVAHGLLPRP
jgi:nonribosomal peptide synthetase MxcG